MGLVSLVRAEHGSLMKTLEESMNLIHYKIPESIERVVIKPNMCYYWDYSTGQTTHPRLIAALIELLREKVNPNIQIAIVEADASAMRCVHVFKFLGYEEIAERYNVDLVNLSKTETEEVRVHVANNTFKLRLPLIIKNADLRINVPKIKYMTPAKISGALKNIFGANPKPSKYKYHSQLNETIIAVNKLMQFDLHILDGMIVTGRSTARLGLIMASQDPVALDAAAATLVNVNPKTVKHIVLAHKEGLGSLTYVPKGLNLEVLRSHYPRIKPVAKLLNLAYKLTTQTGLLQV